MSDCSADEEANVQEESDKEIISTMIVIKELFFKSNTSSRIIDAYTINFIIQLL